MEFIKNVVNRQDGNGFRFPKFHQILHALQNTFSNGSMKNLMVVLQSVKEKPILNNLPISHKDDLTQSLDNMGRE